MILPRGRVIDLSTNRSKYHALRQGDVSQNPNHRKLYPLVDIIYRQLSDSGKPKTGWTGYDYNYSGYTLDSVRFAKDWTEEEKTTLAEWIQQETQRRIIETARRRLIENQEYISVKNYSAPEHLYNVLLERINSLPMQRATAEQWLATINNQTQKGIREEEIKWSCITRYLCQQISENGLPMFGYTIE